MTDGPARAGALIAVGLAFLAQPLLTGGYGWAGIAVLAAGAAVIRWSGIRWPAMPRTGEGERGMTAVVFTVFVLALAVRMWRLESIPPVWWDEGVEMYDARCIAYGLPLEPLTGIHYHRSPLWSRIIALAGWYGDFSIQSLRMPSALAGALAVALATATSFRLAGCLSALVAGGWLIGHPWELHLSRIMMGNITVPLAGAAIVFVALLRRPALPVRAVIAGGIAGLSVWGYAAALALPPLAVLAIGLLSPAGLNARIRSVLVCAGVALLVAAPTVLVAPEMWNKTRQVSAVGSPRLLMHNIADSARMFHREGDTDLRHNHPAGAPVFRFRLAPLFSLGLMIAAAAPRLPGAALALGWLFLGLLPGLASEGGSANQFRMAGVPPAAALVAGVGASLLPHALGPRMGWTLAMVLVASGAVTDLRGYFFAMPGDPATAVWYRTWGRSAGQDLARLAAGPIPGTMTISPPLDLVRHPLEKALLFDALRSGRMRFADDGPVTGSRTEYRDPWGEPQAVLIISGNRIRYLTVLDVSGESDALIRKNRDAAAVRRVRFALTLLPDSALLHERLGFALLAAGDSGGAERAFREAVRLRPRLAASWNGLGAALFRQRRLRAAESAVLEAVRHAPGEPEFTADLRRIREAMADMAVRND